MKIRNKEKRLCGGKLVITDFKKMNQKNLLLIQDYTPEQLDEELAVCTAEGKIYINSRMEGNEMVFGIFENIMPENSVTLDGYIKEIKIRLPEIRKIKNFEDWAAWAATEQDKEKIVHALAVLIVPLELKRRLIESSYYEK